MLKHFKSIALMICLLGNPVSVIYATQAHGENDFRAAVQQQNKPCTGVVRDAMGDPIIGASVAVKGTTNGAITNIDGEFTLNNVKSGATITVSFVGYTPVEVAWNGTPLDVTLHEDAALVDEVKDYCRCRTSESGGHRKGSCAQHHAKFGW